MTSFIINAHLDRPPAPSWMITGSDSDCSFCRIIKGELPAYRVFENEKVLAILDILPLRKGHTLVIPKIHQSRISELPPDYAASVGEAVSKVAHALAQAMDNTALNVVCNQEYAQAVPHVHFHIIPAPTFGSSSSSREIINPELSKPGVPLTTREMHQKEFESRDELDEDDAKFLVTQISARL